MDIDTLKNFTPNDKKIYSYLNLNKNKLKYMTIRELANELNLSTNTIIRFYKKLNFSNYTEFKLKFTDKFNNKENFNININEIINFFNKINNEYFINKIDEASQMILYSDFVIFIGIGNSGGIANYGARIFSNVGKFAISITDPFHNAEHIPPNALVIVLSVSGETKEIIQEINNYIKSNIPILSITSTATNTVAKLSDLNISYYLEKKERLSSKDLSSQIPAVTILELLAQKIYYQ